MDQEKNQRCWLREAPATLCHCSEKGMEETSPKKGKIEGGAGAQEVAGEKQDEGGARAGQEEEVEKKDIRSIFGLPPAVEDVEKVNLLSSESSEVLYTMCKIYPDFPFLACLDFLAFFWILGVQHREKSLLFWVVFLAFSKKARKGKSG